MEAFSKLRKVFQFLVEYSQDLYKFVIFNGYSPLVEKNRRAFYKLIIEVHTIEKGLSLESPKPLFGKEKIKYVMATLDNYDVSFSSFPAEMALGALKNYVEFHEEKGIHDALITDVKSFLSRWRERSDFALSGGVKKFSFESGSVKNGWNLVETRASCRLFNGQSVSDETLWKLAELSQRAPSQCNRQSSKLYAFRDRQKIDALLALQGGSRGFSEKVGNLFIVTSEIAAWGGAGQRNQLYVDGALFAMNVLLACHAEGLAACPLNLAVSNRVEKEICQLAGIPVSERLIMMVAFGPTINEPLRVANSPRRAVREILNIH